MIKVFFILLIAMSLQADSLKMLVSFLKMDYEERSDSGDFLDSEKSDYTDIIGAELEYKLDLSKGHGGADVGSLLLSVSYQEGESKYDGFLQSGGAIVSSYKTSTDIKIIKPKIRWLEMKRGVSYDVGIFTSLAYRYWKRDSSSDKYGYLEEYKWGYVDAGLMAIFHDEKWHIGFEAAYQKAINPTLYAGVNGGLDFDLGDTSGYNLVVPLSYDFSDNISLEVAYEYDMWDIKRSNEVDGYYEPKSKTKNETIKVGLVFKW